MLQYLLRDKFLSLRLEYVLKTFLAVELSMQKLVARLFIPLLYEKESLRSLHTHSSEDGMCQACLAVI